MANVADILSKLSPEDRAALAAESAKRTGKAVKLPTIELGGQRVVLSVRKHAEGKQPGYIGRFKATLPHPETGADARFQCNVDLYVVREKPDTTK